MNKTIKQLLAISALTASLAACGNSGGSGSPQGQNFIATQVNLNFPEGATALSSNLYINTAGTPGDFTLFLLNGTTSTTAMQQRLALADAGFYTIESAPFYSQPSFITYDYPRGIATFTDYGAVPGHAESMVTAWVASDPIISDGTMSVTWRQVSTDTESKILTAFYAVGESVVVGYTRTVESPAFHDLAFATAVESTSPESVTTLMTTDAFTPDCAVNQSNLDYITALSTTTDLGGQVGNNYVGVGTHLGGICIYGFGTTNHGWRSLTESAVTKGGYTTGSPVDAIQFIAAGDFNYGYWANDDGRIWRVIAYASDNKVKEFVQLNGSDYHGSIPNASTAVMNTLVVDQHNNVFIGGTAVNTGVTVVYLLRTNGSHTWVTANLGTDNSGVASITFSADPSGNVVPTVSTNEGNVFYLSGI